MSAMALRLSRNANLRAGLFGAFVGAIVTMSIVFAVAMATSQRNQAPGVPLVSGPAAVIDVQGALQRHLAVEYGSTQASGAHLDVWAALQEHRAIEYGGASSQAGALTFAAAWQRHLVLEYDGR